MALPWCTTHDARRGPSSPLSLFAPISKPRSEGCFHSQRAQTNRGWLSHYRAGSKARLPELPVGTRLRILPNHACATVAQFDGYEVLPADPGALLAHWARFRGW